MRTAVVIGVKMKLALSALLALLVATMICSGVRADVITPQSLLLGLKETVVTADDWLFRGYVVTNTRQLKDALARKIDATIGLYDTADHDDAESKLRNDIAPKLTICDTTRVRAKSWLYVYPMNTDEYRRVSSFAAQCQEIIESILTPNG